MPRSKVTFDAVRKVALELPGVEEGTTYGSPAFKVRGKLLACLAVHKSAEPGSLVVRLGFERRTQLITADSATYYLTDHYLNYPVVLARLSRLDQHALRDLLNMARRFVDEHDVRRKRSGSRARLTPAG